MAPTKKQPKKKAAADITTSGVSRIMTSMYGTRTGASESEATTASAAAALSTKSGARGHDADDSHGMKRRPNQDDSTTNDNSSISKRGRRKRGGGGNNNSNNDSNQSNDDITSGINRTSNDRQQRHPNSRKRRSVRQQQRTRKQAPKSLSSACNDIQDDIEQQLQRQRQKQQAEKEKEGHLDNYEGEEEDGTSAVVDHTEATSEAEAMPEKLGRYRYDPKRKAYFPSNYSFPEDESSADDEKRSSSTSFSVSARYRTFPHSPLKIDATTASSSSSSQRQEKEAINNTASSTTQEGRHMSSSSSSSSSSISFPYPVASCSNLSQRLGLVSTWAGRAVLESFGWTPSAAQLLPIALGTKEHQRAWSYLHGCAIRSSSSSSSQGNGIDDARPIDIECKIGTVPWTRTFDVAPFSSMSDDDYNKNHPPSIVTVTDAEYVVKQQGRIGHMDFRRHCLGASVHSPRFLDAGDFNLGTLDTSHGRSSLRLCKMDNIQDDDDSSGPLGVVYNLPVSQNDFVSWDGDSIVFAPVLDHTTPPGRDNGNNSSRTTYAYSPWLLCLEHGSFGQFQRVRGTRVFPNSETLCVEADPCNNAGCFYFGHRNGQVSLFDINSEHCPSTSNKDNNLQSFGSAMSIHPLSLSPRQVLVRGGQGSCRLYDFRKLSSNSSSSGDVHKNNKNDDPSLVYEMTPLPLLEDNNQVNGHQHRGRRHQRCKRLTNRCNGVVTNPEETVVISPYVDVQGEDQDEMPSLGFWSLHTGDWIGSKPLAPSLTTADGTSGSKNAGSGEHFPATTQWGVSWVELNKRVTRAWEWRKPKLDENEEDDDDEDNDDDLRPRPGSFGLWYKCGQTMAGPGLPASAGSIHHVFATGKPPA